MCKFFTLFKACLLVALLSSSAHAAQIFKWVDDKGVLHYGAEPSREHASERVTNRTYRSSSTFQEAAASPTEAPNQKIIDQQVRQQIAQEEAERKENCTLLRTNLAQLKNNPRLLAEIDGKTVRLTEEQRQERIAETEQRIADYCN